MIRICFVMLLAACANCGDDGNHADAMHNNGDGLCGNDNYFTGEVVDWDPSFCGVMNAKFTVRTDTSKTDLSNPNGRFELCITPAPQTIIDVTPPTTASQCAFSGMYTLPGIAVANEQVINSGKTHSMRMIGMDELGTFFPAHGITLDPGKAMVFVHQEGTLHPVTSSAAHDPPLALTGGAWASGDSGDNVVFVNTDVGGGTTTIGVGSGTAIGTGSVPVAAGTFTYVTIVGS